MKSIVVKINRLGVIRDSIIELSPLVVLSGESGLGKSYAAFLLHYVYKMVLENRLDRFFEEMGWSFEKFENKTEGSLKFSTEDLQRWINKDVVEYLRDLVGNSQLKVDVSFSIPFSSQEYVFSYKSEQFEVSERTHNYLYFELGSQSLRVPESIRNLGVLPWTSLLKVTLNEDLFGSTSLEETFLMAPGRGALLNVGSNLQDFVKGSSGMYSEFLRDWQIVKEMAPNGGTDVELKNKIRLVNGGEIMMKEQNLLFRMGLDKDDTLPIAAAASSVKELAPLAMLVDKYPIEGLSILFEEPEAHLHPSKQIAMADFVLLAVKKGCHMQITTHSDYFIRRINDILALEKIRQLDEKACRQLCKEIGLEEKILINDSMIGAYLLRRREDGSVEIVKQSIDHGIPYDSFQTVLYIDYMNSIKIERTLKQLRDERKD